jgi:hypothetical protein
MNAITRGDFILPLTFKHFLQDQFYVWSYVTGTPNLDEALRFLVRIPNFVIFAIFGSNVVTSYFYLASVTVLSFVSFYYFARHFLGVNHHPSIIVLSLLYTINPIFLGNYAKLGLILAINMLPLILTFLKKYHQTHRFLYLLGILLALNVSFIHPFTLAVNAAVLVAYIGFLATNDRKFLRKNFSRLLLTGLLFVLINAYIIFAVIGVGTVSKGALSQSLDDNSLIGANLIDIANTGDLLTSFSLSKNVFLDFNFYDQQSRFIYYFGAYFLLGLLVVLLIRSRGRLTFRDDSVVLVSVAALLALILLATGTAGGIDRVIAALIELPGGWAFRSPLKWQLYVPLALAIPLLVLSLTLSKRGRAMVLGSILVAMVALNGFLLKDVYAQLIVPKNLASLTPLNDHIKDRERGLLVRDETCETAFQTNFSLLNSIRATYAAKNAQLKEVNQSNLDAVNTSVYNHILSCKELPNVQSFAFQESQKLNILGMDIMIYDNTEPKAPVYNAQPTLIPGGFQGLPNTYTFMKNHGVTADFVDEQNANRAPSRSVEDVFANIDSQDIAGGKIMKKISLPSNRDSSVSLDFNPVKRSVFYRLDQARHELHLASQPSADYTELNGPIDLNNMSGDLTVYYEDPAYDLVNLVRNPSLESGLWQSAVWDCFAYDANPILAMRQDQKNKTDGQTSLQIEATKHIGCTAPNDIEVEGNSAYMLAFDYRTVSSASARYSLSFDDANTTSFEKRLVNTKGEWQSFQRILTAPADARSMQLKLYGIPDSTQTTITNYDNFKLIRLPDITGKFFIYEQPSEPPVSSQAMISSTFKSPVEIPIEIRHAKGTIDLALNDSYHSGWRLKSGHSASHSLLPHDILAEHYKINNQENAWAIDIDALCQNSSLCERNADGSYNLSLVAYYQPQQWFMAGGLISGMTLAGSIGYASYESIKLRGRTSYRGKQS